MALAHSKLTAQGQISVPAEVRRRLSPAPGSVIEWDADGEQLVVRPLVRYSSQDIHKALSPTCPNRRSLAELKEGVRCGSAMRAIDTNVLVRIIIRDDARQTTAADRFVERGAWVSVLALAEASWVLTSVYDRSPAELAVSIRMLLDHEHIALQDPDMIEAALDAFRARPSVGFSDCLLLEIARKAGHLPSAPSIGAWAGFRDQRKL